MVIELITNPLKAEKRPWEVFFLGIVYASIAIVLSLWVFRQQSSLLMVFLTVIASLPLVYNTIKYEEKKDMVLEVGEKKLLEEHGKAIMVFVALFTGFLVAFSTWYLFLPADTITILFKAQAQTISTVNSAVTGGALSIFSTVMHIFLNNSRVLIICILFSFLFGAGAIFILTWNASVGGAFIGNLMRSRLIPATEQPMLIQYFQVASLGIIRYMPHGILEMASYFVGGLAGGIISVAIIRHDIRTAKFEKIIFDSSDLILLAIVGLIIAAFIEVTITPGLVGIWNNIF